MAPLAVWKWGGPVGKGELEPYAYDKGVMAKLWDRSERTTGFGWRFD